ncbi:MAG: aminoglycoside phosphotransferase family protein [Clostridia bacterium]
MQLAQFKLCGAPISVAPYGSGHINQTSLVVTDAGHRYILQKVNRFIFRDVARLMDNISRVTAHLREKDAEPRHVLRLIETIDGQDYLLDEAGDFFRVYDFVEGSVCLDQARSPEDFHQSAVAFGTFQDQLSDFPADTLYETIPHFHDTPDRYRKLKEAIAADAVGRLATVGREVDFALGREAEAGTLMQLLKDGELPLRVTHNDTKLNNVLLDEHTHKPLCVIDLDTVMPGLAANDFGDSIRFGASTGAEDEVDLARVNFSMQLYETYLAGFWGACGQNLTRLERETLPIGAKLMTLECGVRFLTDYLAGDTYFHIHRPQHNLDRCRTQFKLVACMEDVFSQMNQLTK